DQVEHRCLAGAIGPDQCRAHPALDRETQILDHAQAAEVLADGFEAKDLVARAHPARSFGTAAATAAGSGSARVKPSRRRNCALVTSPSGRSAMITIKAAAKAT